LWGQTKVPNNYSNYRVKNYVLDLGVFYTPIASKNALGYYLQSHFYFKRFSIGVDFGGTPYYVHTNNTYSYPISKPGIGIFFLSMINQYDFLRKKGFAMNVSLKNGWTYFSLVDLSKKTLYSGYYGSRYSPTVLATNDYYLLEPGLSARIQLSGRWYLTLKPTYRFLFGKTVFGTKNQFENFSFATCITWWLNNGK
jgi:hypothetical protein